MSRSAGKTKYLFLVGDGMADYPVDSLGGRTPLEAAYTPHMDRIAACRVGLVKTIPEGMEAGSDVANLSLMGYDPRACHTGRAPLEAASMGIRLGPGEIAFRLNLVTLEWRSPREIIMISHSSGDIESEDARQIVDSLKVGLGSSLVRIYPGVAYRNLLVWDEGPEKLKTIPPHDVLDENMAPYLEESRKDPVVALIRRSWEILKDHPVNRRRIGRGCKAANSIWLWGQGKAPALPLFQEKYGLRGGVISAVDLLKGMGAYAGLEAIPVKGATGYLNTNFYGKAEEALKALDRLDFMFVHVEAPDEASHSGNLEEKIEAIEAFDKKVVGTVLKGASRFEDYRVLVVSDHLTPLIKRTHTGDPTLFAWASKEELSRGEKGPGFSEPSAEKSGLLMEKGEDLMPAFLSKKPNLF
jgi:2,3-bisphosphoglycerate-independent phosphoglycerate mutase